MNFPPLVGCQRCKLVTMPRDATRCQCNRKGGNDPDCLLDKEAALFVRRVRRAHVQVAQVAQHGLIFFAHAPREIRVIQVLVPRRFRHILQNTQPLLNRPSSAIRQLFPLRRQIIPDMVLLLRRQFIPLVNAPIYLLPLCRSKIPFLVVVLDDLSLLLRTQLVKFLLWWRRVSRWRPVRMDIWRPHQVSPIGVRTRGTIRAGVLPLVLRSAYFLPLLSIVSLLFLSLPLSRWLLSLRLALLLRRFIVLPILRPVRARSLRESWHRQRCAESQRYQPSGELEFPSHSGYIC